MRLHEAPRKPLVHATRCTRPCRRKCRTTQVAQNFSPNALPPMRLRGGGDPSLCRGVDKPPTQRSMARLLVRSLRRPLELRPGPRVRKSRAWRASLEPYTARSGCGKCPTGFFRLGRNAARSVLGRGYGRMLTSARTLLVGVGRQRSAERRPRDEPRRRTDTDG